MPSLSVALSSRGKPGVPIFSDPPTARALYASVEIGDPIDREHFAAVAVAVRFAR